MELGNQIKKYRSELQLSQDQFDKSFGDMMSKMGFDTDGNSTK